MSRTTSGRRSNRALIARARIAEKESCFAPIPGEYPGRAGPALFGVYIDHSRRAVEFYDSYPTSERAKKAREYYIFDSTAISKIPAGGGSQAYKPVKPESAEEGGSQTALLALISPRVSEEAIKNI